MKKSIILIFVFLSIAISQANLFAVIYSRVEGIISDKDSGQPIMNANVFLYICDIQNNSCLGIRERNTDAKGYFKFDDLFKGYYFLCVIKKGHVKFGPLWKPRIVGSVFEGRISARDKKTFLLKEGQIKHLAIKMEVGGNLELKVTRKTSNGSVPIKTKEFSYLVYPNSSNKEDFLIGDELGDKDNYIIEDLPAGNSIRCEFLVRGYPKGIFTVVLEKGKTKTLEYVMDYTVGQVIHGIVREKGTGKLIHNYYVSAGISNKKGLSTYSDENGEFWFGGIEPGTYNIVYSDNNGLTGRIIDVKPNEIFEMIIEI